MLSVITTDINNNNYLLSDLIDPLLTSNENGFFTFNAGSTRDFNGSYQDLSLNCFLGVFPEYGDFESAFEGRFEGTEPSIDGMNNRLGIHASGYQSTWNDGNFNGELTGTPEGIISQLFSGGYLPDLVSDSTGWLTTGLASRTVKSDDWGSGDVKPGEVIKYVCDLGDSSNNEVIAQVFEGRKLTTKAINYVNPVPRYTVSRANVLAMGLSRSLLAIYNRIIVRYTDLNGVLQRYPYDDPNGSDQTFKSSFGVAFRRTAIKDITSQGPRSSADAIAVAAVLMKQMARLQNQSSRALVISQDLVVIDNVLGMQIPNWKVRPGNFIEVPDLYPFPALAGATAAATGSLQTTFYISQADYRMMTGELSLIAETSTNLASL